MKTEIEQFLNIQQIPARLSAEEAAWYLGFSPHEIPILMAAGVLKPLGHPPANGVKYFAMANLEDLRRDTKWLARASDTVVEYWRFRNSRKSKQPVEKDAGSGASEKQPGA